MDKESNPRIVQGAYHKRSEAAERQGKQLVYRPKIGDAPDGPSSTGPTASLQDKADSGQLFLCNNGLITWQFAQPVLYLQDMLPFP